MRGGFQGGPAGHQGGFHGGNIVKETATVLGIEESAVQASLQEGKTLLEIATAAGLTEDDFVAKLVAAETAAIDEQVTAGSLTQDQADQIKTDLSSRVKQQVENKGFGNRGGFPGGNGGPMGGQRGPGGFGGGLEKEAATILGVEESSIQDSLKDGKTLVQVAEAAGMTEADFLAKLVEAKQTAIAADVTAGKITQEQADKMTGNLSDHLKQQIENPRPQGGPGGRPDGGRGFGGGMMGSSEALTTILGMTQDELKTERDAGKSIVEIAAAKGISEDDLISKLKESMTDALKKFVEDTHQKPAAPAPDASAAPTADSSAIN
ncbi:hypothetical protein [Paenibacillus hexagrammi]|uniref:LysM domain-containing protein n=1 Tax=Paenibacillus hexagrammi TaxID=2908839 RepID=A0ABY3SG13_9BACL|nr:hypothetical protein [Paenibacillus sp. YPD9-1]UJF32861.1 hypothetical protein L0M14_25330 [Paenibacillus sp. YPD9-1]